MPSNNQLAFDLAGIMVSKKGKKKARPEGLYLSTKMVERVKEVHAALQEAQTPEAQADAVALGKQVFISLGTKAELPKGWTRGRDSHSISYKQAPDLQEFLNKAASLIK